MKNFVFRSSFVVFFILLAGAFFSVPVRAQEPAPRLEILNESITVVTSTEKGADNAAVITIRNNGPAISDAQFRVAVDTTEGTTPIVAKPATVSLGAYTVSQVKLEFDPVEEAQSGYLVLEAEGIAPALCPLTIDPPKPAVSYGLLGANKLDASIVLLWSFWIGFLGFVFVGVMWCLFAFQSRKKDPLKPNEVFHARMDTALHWDFSKNWASSFGLLGAFFVGLAGMKVIPEAPTLFSAGSLTVIVVVFPALIALAPMVVSSLNSFGKEPLKKDGNTPILFEGAPPVLILPFVIGSALVVWAVTGEMIALIALFAELQVTEIITSNVEIASQILVVFFWIAGFYYSLERVVQSSLTAKKPEDIINEDAEKDKKQTTVQPGARNLLQLLGIPDDVMDDAMKLTRESKPTRKLYLP